MRPADHVDRWQSALQEHPRSGSRCGSAGTGVRARTPGTAGGAPPRPSSRCSEAQPQPQLQPQLAQRPNSTGRMGTPTPSSTPRAVSGSRAQSGSRPRSANWGGGGARPASTQRQPPPTSGTAAVCPGRCTASRPAAGTHHIRDDTTPRLHTAYMLSPERRLEDAQRVCPVTNEEEQQALHEELKSWYFGCTVETESVIFDSLVQECTAGVRTAMSYSRAPLKPPLGALEEAAAAMKARAMLTEGTKQHGGEPFRPTGSHRHPLISSLITQSG
eukprot:gnl/TRDRNA2_/TRDRNA2_85723_c1_seq1.p1 gnl/TRDRNA2_/TRDRNA2_85723_c1~~gnl/TRDRNA2_/TRDRNA2_85723_c1_seq1.p1  ORF type:complete len:273 (-),score=24.11 gnl/TRDRNA2_/TRDRNA2_85723_c1_seq1:199-1017(-)